MRLFLLLLLPSSKSLFKSSKQVTTCFLCLPTSVFTRIVTRQSQVSCKGGQMLVMHPNPLSFLLFSRFHDFQTYFVGCVRVLNHCVQLTGGKVLSSVFLPFWYFKPVITKVLRLLLHHVFQLFAFILYITQKIINLILLIGGFSLCLVFSLSMSVIFWYIL